MPYMYWPKSVTTITFTGFTLCQSMLCISLCLSLHLSLSVSVSVSLSLSLSLSIYIYIYIYSVLCLVAQSCPILWDQMDCSPPGHSVYGDSPGKNRGMGCHVLLHGIFRTQGSNPGLLHCKQIFYHLSHQEVIPWCLSTYSPGVLPWIEEIGRLQSVGSQRVRLDSAINSFTFIYLYLSIYLFLSIYLSTYI